MEYCAWSWSHFGQSWSSQAWQNQATLFFHPVCWLLGTLVGAGAFGATAWATAWARVGLARPEPVAISASVELAASTGTGLVASTGSGRQLLQLALAWQLLQLALAWQLVALA